MGGTLMARALKMNLHPSVQSLSRVRLFATTWAAARQASLSITNSRSSPKPMSIESVMPSNHHILCHSLFLLPSIFPSIRGFSNSRLFTLAGQSTGALASASFHPMNSQAWFHYDWLVWSPCHPRDSQESSAIPQFKNINTSVLSPALTSLGDYGKNHSFHYTDVCWQSNVSDF